MDRRRADRQKFGQTASDLPVACLWTARDLNRQVGCPPGMLVHAYVGRYIYRGMERQAEGKTVRLDGQRCKHALNISLCK